jgi:hypothetical protein
VWEEGKFLSTNSLEENCMKLISKAFLSICICGSLSAIAYGQKPQPSAGTKQSLDVSKKVKFKDKTEINFDDANIDGTFKSPFGTLLSNRDQDFNKGFIKLRTNWHDQMVTSVSGISQ